KRGKLSMLPKRRMVPHVEMMESKQLLSAARAVHPRNVDITGEVMRMNLTTPPRTIGRNVHVYSVQGTGGVDELGSVQVSGTATDSGRAGAHIYKGSLTLSNNQGSVSVRITGGSYRITGGTGAYRGATGLGVVTYGTSASGDLIGMAF